MTHAFTATCPAGHERSYTVPRPELAVMATGIVPVHLYCLDCGEQWSPDPGEQSRIRAWAERAEAAPDPLRWTLHKGARLAQCRIEPHPLGCEVRVEVDGEVLLTQVHRLHADADIHAATLEDQFGGKGWGNG